MDLEFPEITLKSCFYFFHANMIFEVTSLNENVCLRHAMTET